MKVMIFKELSIFLFALLATSSSFASEEKSISEHQINFYNGNFDFSDDKQKAISIGFNTKMKTYLEIHF